MSRFAELNAEEQARIEAAAEWRQRLRQNPVLELSAEYIAWLSDPRNSRIANAMEDALGTLDAMASAPELLDLRRKALSKAQQMRSRVQWSRALWAKAAAAIILVALLGGGAVYAFLQTPDSYTTDVGDRRVVALPDGSRISLDSSSRLFVRYSENARIIELKRGRARFDVAHDVTRPFSVTAGEETVVAVGTSFNVERLDKKLLVTVIEGRIVVKEPQPSVITQTAALPLAISAGEKVVFAQGAKPAVAQADLPNATAWEAGRLVFQDESLVDAVEQINRYAEKPVAVDASVAGLRINGVFNAGDTRSFISAVTNYFPVQTTTRRDGSILLRGEP